MFWLEPDGFLRSILTQILSYHFVKASILIYQPFFYSATKHKQVICKLIEGCFSSLYFLNVHLSASLNVGTERLLNS